jgi:predicted Zn finger-like uncharacterized protein
MKITCQSCQSKYTVSDEKVQGRTVKIKCRKCGATILVNSSGVTANGGIADPVSAASGPSDGSTFLVNVADGDQRSMTLAEIVSSYQGAVINADTYVWADGMADWQPLGQVDAIVAALSSGMPPGQASSAEQSAYAGGGALAHAGQPVAEALASSPRAAVRRDPARPTQDLFGGGQAQEPHRGSIDDVATSAPLFSSGAAPGQRDENSMLFSLSALTAKAGTSGSAGAAPVPSGPHDDSGIIDLKALAAGGGSPSPVASLADDGGLFQLSAPIMSAVPAPAFASPSVAPPKNRAPLIIGVGVAIAGIAIVGMFVLMKNGGEPPPAPVSAPTQTAAVAPPEPAPAVEAVAPASAAASASAAPAAARPGNTRALPRSTSGSGAATAKTQPTATAAPAAAPKRNSCGCAPGDLMCAMQCSAKGK